MHEDHLVKLLGISHLYYRRHVPTTTLTRGAQLEIRQQTIPIADLPALYHTTRAKVYNAKYAKPAKEYYIPHPLVTHEEARTLYIQLNDPTPKQLTAYGFSQPAPQPHFVDVLVKEGVKYQDIASILGYSLSQVKARARVMGHKRSPQGLQDPHEVLAYAKLHGKSKASEKYNVSRAYIYYHEA